MLVWNGWKFGTGETITYGPYHSWNWQHYTVETRYRLIRNQLYLLLLHTTVTPITAKEVSDFFVLFWSVTCYLLLDWFYFLNIPKLTVWVLLPIIYIIYHFIFQSSDSKPNIHCHYNCRSYSRKWQREICENCFYEFDYFHY